MESKYVMHTYHREDILLTKGQGCLLYDDKGNSYIDMTSGIGVNCLGHNHPELVAAIQDQAQTLMHCSNIFYSEPMVLVAKELVEATGMSKMFFANTGAEANEGLIKLARKYSQDHYGKGRHKILSLIQSFHGRTMMTLTATGQDKFHHDFDPFPEGFDYVKANDLSSFLDKLDDSVCCVMMEMIQGEGGVLPLDREFVQSVAKICQERDILVAVDEVQTGIGRTGSLFCYQQYGIHPNIVTMAKGLGGGVVIGGFLVDQKCADVLTPGTHGSTFGGNPLACAAANAVIDEMMSNGFLDSVKEKGKKIKEYLNNNLPKECTVKGEGLLIGVKTPYTPKDVTENCLKKNLLIVPAGNNSVRLYPPLNICDDDLIKGAEIFVSVIKEMGA